MGEERDAIAAFLFTWYDGDVTQMPVKLPKARNNTRSSNLEIFLVL